MSTMEKVKSLKEALIKEMNKAEPETSQLQDILSRLDECKIDLQILTDTLVGKTVSKLKNNKAVGTKARDLIKKWKAIANPSSTSTKNAAENDKMPRRESLNTGASDPEAEWNHLPTLRQNICRKFHEILVASKPYAIKEGVNEEALNHLLAPRAAEIETSVENSVQGTTIQGTKAYTDKARSLAFNLKKNHPLCLQVILGEITTDQLVEMSPEQLASAEVLKQKAEQAKKLIDSKRLDWDKANEDKINEMCGIKGELLKASLFTCGRCKSTKTTSTQKQTRSADEPMTVSTDSRTTPYSSFQLVSNIILGCLRFSFYV